MKLPNGYGTVYKLSGARRRPYAVKVRVGSKQKAILIYVRRFPVGNIPTLLFGSSCGKRSWMSSI